MNIAISLNKPFIRYGYVMLTSVFENHRNVELNVCVLHRDISDEEFKEYKSLAERYGQKLSTLCITEDMIPGDLPNTDKWPIEVYFRMMLPFLLSNEDKVLYLDTDIIVRNELTDLYDVDMGDKLFAAAVDNSDGNLSDKQHVIFDEVISSDQDFHYINSGVLLMNLRELRKVYSIESFLKTAERFKESITAFDQDLINYMFHGRMIYIPSEKYNLFARLYYNSGYNYEKVKDAKVAIIHYSGPKPWSGQNLRTDIEKFWWEYARLTPYYHEFLEELVEAEMSRGYESTNEFKYQEYLLGQAEMEIKELKKRETEYIKLIDESRVLLEKLSLGD